MAHIVNEKALTIYTDGSSYSHPRRGGIGIVLLYYVGNEEKCLVSVNKKPKQPKIIESVGRN